MHEEIAIKVENLSKVFSLRQSQIDEDGNAISEHWALKDVSFEIKKGESVGIIGPNGSGKSTLLKILAGVIKPTDGSAKIRGKVASILDIGAGFHPELSGRENVFLNGQIHGFTKKEIEAKFDEIVAFSGIEKFIDEPVKIYSNGMYLRLAFSIMAHLDFDVYLLDEVLSVGDVSFRKKSQQKIHEIHQLKQKTLIIISHYLWELVGSDRIFHINNGILDSQSSKHDVIKKYSPNESQSNLMINNPFFINKYLYSDDLYKNFVDRYELNIHKSDGKITDSFRSDEDVHLSINLINSKSKFYIGLILLDQFNNPVIEVSSFFDDIHTIPGTNQQLTMHFPGRFFNKNSFSIDLIFFTQTEILLFSESVANFDIKIEKQYENTIFENTWGAVKPFLKWENKISI